MQNPFRWVWIVWLTALAAPILSNAQTPGKKPQPPAAYGGRNSLTLDLRDPQAGSMGRTPVFDYIKFSPHFRSLAPVRRKCVTVEMEQDRKAKHGGETKEEFEAWLERNAQLSRDLQAKGFINPIYSLPVVVHVIYSKPIENISDAQIRSQIEALNQDFRRTNSDAANTEEVFRKAAVDTEIEFCLASIDPQGRATNGIHRVSLAGSPFNDSYLNEVIKPNTIWDPKRYMNIWVCNMAGGVLGFAQFPSSSGLDGLPEDPGAGTTDGVAIHYTAFGTHGTAVAPFNQGRTTTHEVGHWLGLRHIWGDGPCDMDDFCDDTPSTSGPNFSCPTGQAACAGPAMVQNFMDYTDDACMNLFTLDQKTRMRTVIESSPRRRSLIDSDACSELILPPVADFAADLRFGCGPLQVKYSDRSRNHPKHYQWSFPGGKPAISHDPQPTVTYDAPGTYSVSLKTSNDFGESKVAAREDYIVVSREGKPLPLFASFDTVEEAMIPGFFIQSSASPKGWEITHRVGGKGQSAGAVWFNNFENNQVGSIDWLVTPLLDLSQARNTSLAFDVAYSRFDDRYSDTLGVLINTSCGTEFKAIYRRGGKDLATSQDQMQPFSPLPEAWRSEYLDLSAYDGFAHVQIAFVNISGYGNNLYLDNIHLTSRGPSGPEPDFVAIERLLCPGDTVHFRNLSGPGAEHLNWSFPGGFPATDTGTSPAIVYPAPGSYDVLLTVSGPKGSRTLQKRGLVQVKPGPELNVNVTEASICRGGSIALRASGAEDYSWSPSEGLSYAFGPTVQAGPDFNTVYTLTGTAPNGCKSRKIIDIQVREAATFSVTPAEAHVCPGEGVLLTASGAESYVWAPTEGLSRTEGSSVIAAPESTTTYTVTGVLGEGCSFSKTITVEVEKAVQVFARAEKTQICPGEPVRLRATGGASPQWTPDDGSPELEGWEVVVSPTRTTTYRVVAADSGCQVATQLTLMVKPKPVITPGKTEYIVCPGSTGEISVSGAQTFLWLPAEGLSITRGATIPVNPRETCDYVVQGTNAEGCSDTAVIRVTVPPAPALQVSNSRPTLCPGMKSTLSASGASHYQWAPALGLDRTEGATVIAQPEVGVTYVVTATDSNGCSARRQVRVNVGGTQAPQANFSLTSQRVCAGQSLQFVDRSRSATAYQWEFPGATPAQSQQQNPLVQYNLPGRYDIILRVVGCNGKDERFERGYVEVVPATRMSVQDSFVTVCQGEPVSLKAGGMRGYRWSPRIGLNAYQGPEVEARLSRDVTYTVTGIDPNGCENTATVRVKVRGEADQVAVFSSSSSVCAGQTVKLQAHGAEDFVWFSDAGEFAGVGEVLEVQPERTVSYRLETRDRFGCISNREVRVEVRPRPSIDLVASRTSVCAGDSLFLEARGGLQYQWPSQEGIIRSRGSQAVALPLTSATFRVIGTDGLGCSAEGSVKVAVSDGRSLQVTAQDTILCQGDTTSLSASGGTSYQWSPISGVDRISAREVRAFPKHTTTYLVKSLDGEGCPAIGAITLVVSDLQLLKITPMVKEVCPGDTVLLEASGGVTYEWLPAEGLTPSSGARATVSPRESTTYQVLARDALGCEARGAATLTVRSGEELRLSASSAAICLGETVTLQARGGQVLSWLPSTGMPQNRSSSQQMQFRPEVNTRFMAIGRLTNGCLDTAILQVNVSSLEAGFSLPATTVDLALEDGAVQFSDASVGNPVSWHWDFGDGGTSEEANPVHIYPEEGQFVVRMRSSDGVCVREARDTLRVINTSDLEELLDEGQIRIFPQPTTNGRLTLEIQSAREMYLRYRLLDVRGQSLLSDFLVIPKGQYRQQLNLSFFPKGVYILQLTDGHEVYDTRLEYK